MVRTFFWQKLLDAQDQSNNGGRQSTDPDCHETSDAWTTKTKSSRNPRSQVRKLDTGGTIPTLNRASSSGQKDTLKNSQAVTVTKVKSGWDVRVQAGFDASVCPMFAKKEVSQTGWNHGHWEVAHCGCGGGSSAKPEYTIYYGGDQYDEPDSNPMCQVGIHRTPSTKASTSQASRQSLAETVSVAHDMSG